MFLKKFRWSIARSNKQRIEREKNGTFVDLGACYVYKEENELVEARGGKIAFATNYKCFHLLRQSRLLSIWYFLLSNIQLFSTAETICVNCSKRPKHPTHKTASP